jgi:circadian clock protein KaiB
MQLCEEHLAGKYHIEVIDLLENPHLASGDQILAIPTLIRRMPPVLAMERLIFVPSDWSENNTVG